MKGFSIVSFALVSASLIVMTGCAKAPESELSTAKAALDSARSVQAETYVAAEFSAASDSLKAAQTEIEKQKSGLVGRNYDKAKALLASATLIAHNAQIKAVEEKQKMKVETDSAMSREDTLIGETKTLLAKAPKGKDGKTALEAIGSEIEALEASHAETMQIKSIENYPKAISQVNAQIAKLDSIKVELTTAIGKVSAKKSKK